MRRINRVILRITPENIRSTIDGQILSEVCREIGMNINDVGRTDQAGIIEVEGFEIKRIKSSLMAVTVVATRNIHFHSKSRLPFRIPSIAGVQTRRPSEDGFITKSSDLDNAFAIPVPSIMRTEDARTK